ncbi:acetyl-CoA hydrolase/transferase family protein [Thermodesulfobacteriota bacterium]
MNWKEEYERKMISAEQAAELVQSGDNVIIPIASEPLSLMTALISRKEELKGVEVLVSVPLREFPWYEPGWDDAFSIKFLYPGTIPELRHRLGEGKVGDYVVSPSSWVASGGALKTLEQGKHNIVMVEISTPDEHGYCSFGPVLWDRKERIQNADISIAEIRENVMRTYGDNFIHISEIDYIVQAAYPLTKPFPPFEPEPHVKPIAEYVSSLIKDGDTIEIGAGTSSETLPLVGLFNNKRDLGWHTERIPRGTLKLIMDQPEVFSGKYKSLHPGKIIATALALVDQDDFDFVHMNPLFELYAGSYVNDIRVIASNDNMVAINNALGVDLTGQITAETIGSRMWSGAGGQTEYSIGATLSKGGRSIIVLPATAKGGSVSRIVPVFEKGAAVTVLRAFADYVVTEHGIASLRQKSQRERALELISIAHPDFRSELKKEAKKLFWP